MFSVPLTNPFCTLFDGTVKALSLRLNLMINTSKSILWFCFHSPCPSCRPSSWSFRYPSFWSGCRSGTATGILYFLLVSFPVSWSPSPVFCLTLFFWWFLLCSSCLWKAQCEVKNWDYENLYSAPSLLLSLRSLRHRLSFSDHASNWP